MLLPSPKNIKSKDIAKKLMGIMIDVNFIDMSSSIEIKDLMGDNNHYSATITSSQFAGKNKIEQHKMVYNSLKGKMGNELHALAIKTKEQ